jgi:hypothetical protein
MLLKIQGAYLKKTLKEGFFGDFFGTKTFFWKIGIHETFVRKIILNILSENGDKNISTNLNLPIFRTVMKTFL